MTNKLTGNGRPSMHLKGEVGQYYEDLLTGDLYECRVASEFSKTNGRPFGGYVWELRAKGEDVREIYGGSGSSQKKLSEFENDLFYHNAIEVLTITKDDFAPFYAPDEEGNPTGPLIFYYYKTYKSV